MKVRRHLLAAAALAALSLLAPGCGPGAVTAEDYNSRTVTFPNGRKIKAELAMNPRDVRRGMMFRPTLAEDRGMLFIHGKEGAYPYWMFQVLVPLDMIWLDRNQTIVQIVHDAKPCPGPATSCLSYGGAFKSGLRSRAAGRPGAPAKPQARYAIGLLKPMDQEHLRNLLDQVRSGAVEIDEAISRLRHLPFENLGYATLDHHRAIRSGMPEVIFGKGKTREQVVGIATRLLERSSNMLATRTTPEVFEELRAIHPEAEYFPACGALRVWRDRTRLGKGKLAIISAGTTDLPVAEEAVITAEIMGNDVVQVHDVGVAGIHRLFGNFDRIKEARVIVVCAGMEGALPSAVGGLVNCPSSPCPPASATAPAFTGLPRCSACSTVVRATSAWSTSTTASAAAM